MTTKVHPSSHVDSSAALGAEVEIEAGCFVGPDVEIGEGTRLLAGACVYGPTVIGKGNIYTFCSK